MAKSILLVEDENDVRETIKMLLESEGYEVGEARDGFEGLEQLKKKKYDLALVDMFMPKMSGREMCERIRKDPKIKNTKFAFLTAALFSSEGEKELKKLKSLDYIQKPFDIDDLKKRIKKMI